MASSEFNDWLDQQLRGVRVPPALRRRLEDIAGPEQLAWSDAAIDAALCGVAAPADLRDRLLAIAGPLPDVAAQHWTDEQLAALLRNVPVPAGLRERLLEIVRPAPVLAWRRMVRVVNRPGTAGRLAMAASLLVVTSLWLLGMLASVLWPNYSMAVPRESVAAGVELEASVLRPLATLDDPASLRWPLSLPLPHDGAGSALPQWAAGRLVPESPQLPAPAPPAWLPGLEGQLAGSVPEPGVLDRDVLLAAASRFAGDALADGQNLHLRLSDRPRALLAAAGQVPQFQLKGGVFVPVQPRFHPSIDVPLAVDVSSFEMARNWLGTGVLPPPQDIRTEDFLAGLDYQFAQAEPRRIELFAAGSPAPWGGHLLEIGVQARQLNTLRPRPTRMIVLVDLSQSMAQGNRLAMVERGLKQLMAELQPDDRLSLITYSQSPTIVVEDAGPGDLASLLRAVESLAPQTSTNLGMGLMAACAAARRQPPGQPQRVVLLTDGDAIPTGDARQRINSLLASPLWGRLRLDVVQLGNGDSRFWSELAQAARGKWHLARGTAGVHAALRETLTGRQQVVAADARLTLRFNVRNVNRYRPFGHEAVNRADLLPAEVEVDLLSGQAGAALFELYLRPDMGDDAEIAVAQLHWTHPVDGSPRTTTRRITAADMAPSLAAAPPWMQAGALAATTAEYLRRASPEQLHSAGHLLAWARQIDPPPSEARGWPALVELLQQVAELEQTEQRPDEEASQKRQRREARAN